ncbi:MAG: peroxidase family protein [Hyphomicrobiaceae bacterium]|nr:peroxidase family protein [Hyphomicrobiaceae bacterium]
MHGHPFSGPLQIWWGKTNLPEMPRTLFRGLGEAVEKADMFRAGGLISMNGRFDRTQLHTLIARLSATIGSNTQKADNPRIPSGYTYLLQFIAHDMVDSVVSFDIHEQSLIPGSRNARMRPLLLDTLYGMGPDECPHAYEASIGEGQIPRTRLRMGVHQSAPFGDFCPFRDIARNRGAWDQQGTPPLTEAMLADARNDAHALISQLTILFQLLHNHVVGMLERATVGEQRNFPAREIAYRHYHCARTVVTLIYRNIICKDVLRRVLHDEVYRHYLLNGNKPRDSGATIPLEFTFGAFRFGHAMVRDAYDINSAFPAQPTSKALRLSSLSAPMDLPVDKTWFVDWARFFDTGLVQKPNLSKVIGPHYPGALEDDFMFMPPKVPGVDSGGLTNRDLLSACYAGMLSADALCRILREQGFDLVKSFDDWRPKLRTWLLQSAHFSQSPEALDMIARDPPLPFFLLLEAADGGGRHLGPVGSIIVAETILGAMEANPLRVKGDTLRERIKSCGMALFKTGPADATEAEPMQAAVTEALNEIGEIETMPGLLAYMAQGRMFD